MVCKKRIMQAVIVLFAAVLLAFFGAAESNRQDTSADTKEKKLYPSEAEAQALSGQFPLVCTPVSECYQKEEGKQGLSKELLADLQEYVRRGAYAEALADYRDESLLIDVEELLRLCPDYEELIAAEIESGRLAWNEEAAEEDILSGIVQIYALELDDEEGAELLIRQDRLQDSFYRYPWLLLKKTEEGYFVAEALLGQDKGPKAEKEISVFLWENGAESAYYLLTAIPKGRFFLENLKLCGDWREKIHENSPQSCYLFEDNGRYISRETTIAVPHFIYLDGEAALAPAVKEYMEENAPLFGSKLCSDSFSGNEHTIWGDEELIALTEEEKTQIERALTDYYRDIRRESIDHYDYAIYYFMQYIVCADYDNDGTAELFFRDDEEKNILLVQDGSGYKTQYVRLSGEEEAPVVQMWFVEFGGKTVTFAVTTPYGEAYPILSAYLIEGEQRTPLVTCQLVFGETVEIDTRERDFNFKDCPKLSLPGEAQYGSFYEAADRKEEIQKLCANLQVLPDGEESPFPAEFLSFIREGGRELLCGKSIRQYLAPYEVDTGKDTEAFRESADWDNRNYYAGSLHWAYRWEARDGSENFLIWENCELGYYEGMPETASLSWFWDNGENGYREEEIVRFSQCDSAFMISYEGRLYCIVADTSLGVTGASGIYVIALGEAGEWEGYHILLTPKTDAYEPVSLGGADIPATVSGYVEAEYKNMLSACRNGEVYAGWAEHVLPVTAWRDIKNRDAYYNDAGMEWETECTYRAQDADNDGEAEYFATYFAYDKYAYRNVYYPNVSAEYAMYGYQNGKFVEFSLDMLEKEVYPLRYCGRTYAWDLGEGYAVDRYMQQLWFEELDGVTYFFTLELLAPTHSFLLRARLEVDGVVEEAGAWLLCAPVVERIESIVEEGCLN